MTDAFQSKAFQVPGFQTSFSQDAFQRCAFDYRGFQTTACPPTTNLKSGWWRLWLMEMQEEALRQYDEKRKKSDAEAVVEPKKSEPVRKAAVSAPRKHVARKPVEVSVVSKRRFPAIRFTPSPPDEFEQLAPALSLLSQEIYGWYQQHEPLRLLGVELQRQVAVVAANDEDEEDTIELLLLAA